MTARGSLLAVALLLVPVLAGAQTSAPAGGADDKLEREKEKVERKAEREADKAEREKAKVERKAEREADKAEREADREKGKAEGKVDRAAATTKDAWLTSKTKIALLADERVSGSRINIGTANGVVTLRGKVSTADEKKAAEEVTKSVDGVASVKNELQVVPEAARKAVDAKDDELARAVKARLGRDQRLKGAGIDVRADGGVVTLSGEVPDVRTSARASEVARSVPGVKAVKNELRDKS
jgi:hyperosmotically inducible protein